MGATREGSEESGRHPERGLTTLELTQVEDDHWRATQAGVDVVGYGETGALAAMDYCRKIQEAIDGQ